MALPKYLQFQEDGLTGECRELLRTLPSEKGWLATHVYNYQGFWYGPKYLQGVLNCQKHFEAKKSDILLITSPKTGTTWLKALVFSLTNRDCDDQNHPFMSKNPHDIVPYLDINLYADNQAPDLTSLGSPRIFSTHLPFVSIPQSCKDSDCKIVYLCRNPKDTLVSLWHFANNLRPRDSDISLSIEEAFDKFCRGVSFYGPYWDHVIEYWKESLERPNKVLFLKYEELKQEPEKNLKKLAKFLGFPFSVEEEENGDVEKILKLCSFENLSSMEVNRSGKLLTGVDSKYLFRRGEVGDHVNHLTLEMIQLLDQITQKKFNDYGLQF